MSALKYFISNIFGMVCCPILLTIALVDPGITCPPMIYYRYSISTGTRVFFVHARLQGFKLVLLLRLSPLFPFNILNYALGITSMPFLEYVTASWAGGKYQPAPLQTKRQH